ncbi:MAG: POT family MFS transporter [Planctomycetaceae bacterium]|nr:POT family MFS transporter [Planctomycetaceae bacterium]
MAGESYRSTPEETTGLPRGIKYIIGNEAAERFSFYGMRTILVVFMTKYLHYMADSGVGTEMSDAKANEYYHLFVAATYFFPVLGSLLSDVVFGKYLTILWLSIVYCLGHGALALMGGAGMEPDSWLVIGLVLIAVGSGGIKPCVSAHVGDQFGKKNSHMMTKVFQWFYFSINFGSTASTWVTPILLKWYGPHVAFGVPGVLMAIATITFWMGRKVFIHVPAGGPKFFEETFSREGVSALLKLSTIYAFVAVFWGLFDQTGSSWVIQAENMDRNFLGVEWLQSQIQVLNPILVLILIPLFQLVVYPAVDPIFKLTSIRKISIGFFLTTGSFAVVAFAQGMIDRGETPSIVWQLLAYVLLTAGEVMISITGLEFSYTQAPKTMKSVIMAVWLFSVSLGNIFTSIVNNQIQVDGITQVAAVVKSQEVGTEGSENDWTFKTAEREQQEGEEGPGKIITISGYDGEFGTADDITMEFDSYGTKKSVATSEDAVLKEASALIEKQFMASDADDAKKTLPLEEEATTLLADLKDSYGNPLTYKQLSRDKFRITSMGPDGEPQTRWDVILKGSVSRAEVSDPDAKTAPYTWLEQRKIDADPENGRKEVDAARGEIASTEISNDITVGGQDTLEGQEYFWFWTYTILVTSVLFVPVGYFYKERSYIQTEQEGSASDEGDAPSTDQASDSASTDS